MKDGKGNWEGIFLRSLTLPVSCMDKKALFRKFKVQGLALGEGAPERLLAALDGLEGDEQGQLLASFVNLLGTPSLLS